LHLKAIIFDVDGTLANTEKSGHLPATNDAFAALDYPICWSWEEYKFLMETQPGVEWRVRYALENYTPALSPEEIDKAVPQIAARKKQFYVEKYVSQIPLRSGIENLVNEAIDNGIRLAIVTLSHEEQVRALLQYRLPHAAELFDPVLGKLVGVKTAPNSPLYRRCLAQLRTLPEETLAIEDSASGFRAAQTAGLPCAVFYNDYTFGQNFSGAALVARSPEFFSLHQLAELCLPELE
jgi:HAD superfamily hydrolase (TIGR01509 family)